MRCAKWRADAVAQLSRDKRDKCRRDRLRPSRSYSNFNGSRYVIVFTYAFVSRHVDSLFLQSRRHVFGVVLFVGVSRVAIPDLAVSFLSLGDNLVPNSRLPCFREVYRRLFDFRVDVLRKAFFSEYGTNTSDDMRGLRRKFFQPKSSWLPQRVGLCVLHALDEAEASVLHVFQNSKLRKQSCKRPSNLGFTDQWAQTWS